MRYRVRLVGNLKTNYVKLPADSALRQAMTLSTASTGTGTASAFSSNQTSHCSAIKVQPVGGGQEENVYAARVFFFGFVGGVSAEPNTIEISREAALLLQLDDDMLVQVAIEYSYEKLNAIELDPLTVDDYEVIEQNCNQIEEQLLNQVGVFYQGQVFVLFLGVNGTQTVRLRSKIDAANTSCCFFLTTQCELHIIAKTRPRQKEIPAAVKPELDQVEESQDETGQKSVQQDAEQSFQMIIENSKIDTINTLMVYDPDSELGKLAADGSTIVKATFEATPSIADYTFKDFKIAKQVKEPLKIGTSQKEIYFKLETSITMSSLVGDTVQGSFSHARLCGSFASIERVSIQVASRDKIPKMSDHSFTISYQTTNALIRQAATQQNEKVNDIVVNLIISFIESCFRSQNAELLLSEGTQFSLDRATLASLLDSQLEQLQSAKQSKDYQKAIVIQRILASLHKNDLLQFKVHFIAVNNRQVTIDAMAKPQTCLLQLEEVSEFVKVKAMVGFNPVEIKSQSLAGNKAETQRALLKKQEKIFKAIYSDQLMQLGKARHAKESCMIYGTAGVGKSFLFKRDQLAEVIDCTEMVSAINSLEDIAYALEYLEKRFSHFSKRALPGSVLVFDNINGLCGSQDGDQPGSMVEQVKSERASRWLLTKLEEHPDIVMAIVARHFSLVNGKLLDVCCFDTLIELQPPTKQQRYDVVKDYLAPASFQSQEVKLLAMAQSTEYFMARDLVALSEDKRLKVQDQAEFGQSFTTAVTAYKKAVFPASMQQAAGENVPDWETEIGGLEQVKDQVEDMFGVTQQYSVFFKGHRVSQGLLLYGPPGCGKTYVAAAIAKRFNINFISVKGPELLNKYIGASEQNVRELFERAQNQKPSILFFDEFDSLVPKRGSGQTSVTDRIVNQFLCYLDGVEGRDGVFVMAATSRPDLVDVALLRPGRIDKAVLCNFPTQQERKAILAIYLRKFKFNESLEESEMESFLDELAGRTNSFTSADLKGLIQNAQLAKMSIALQEIQSGGVEEVKEFGIDRADVRKAFETFARGMSESEIARFNKIYADYQNKGQKKPDMSQQRQMLK